MTYLAHVHRQLGLVAEVDDALYGSLGWFASVAMAGVHDLVVKLPIAERFEVAIPLGTAQQDDVVLVYLSVFHFLYLNGKAKCIDSQ